ncbi:glycerol-3-phosphate cytidylyltransferase [Oceanobacillus sp. 143]|uniref:Glycerol-3-phosphate cytidylyltransferase n=1 Tax=Oceanobacillus zhaokaii TaxID=2052660 RepID=A0A345PKP2_9BACI|nr:glycerol-3-phosphate cytidylyltransferase [Oceanobacillus zhaokaii]AXI10572.1 glycerol-3-phosphate cytidylyltransferase [Oceanobacillus zhaokaii]QGS69550.1 glycerol-3-phosphate cytidylyltransferase [Oceanobacillus sp. 143]
MKIITYGTFDLIHAGHIHLLRRAKAMGDHLTVGISTDEFNQEKKKQAYHSFEHRKLILESIRYVDFVIPEYSWEQKVSDIKKYNIDIFVMGDDWKGKFDNLQDYCGVIYLPRTNGISSSTIKQNAFLKNRQKF